jgi:hypothetical protein
MAQTIWAPIGATWTYHDVGLGVDGNSHTVIRRLAEEIMVQGKSVKLLEKTDTIYNGTITPTGVYKDTLYSYSEGEKVYIGNDTSHFTLYYDFGAQKADSIYQYRIDTTFTVNMCGGIKGYHAIKQGTCNKTVLDYGTSYERVGNLKGLPFKLLSDCIIFEFDFTLTSYSDASGFQYLPTSGFTCGIVTDLESPNLGKEGILVFPNPFSQTATLQNNPSQNGFTYRIIDNLGEEVLSGILQGTQAISMPQAGIFHLLISDNEKIVLRKKIIQQ